MGAFTETELPFTQNKDAKFGRLTILRELPRIKGRRRVLALCDCGKQKSFDWHNVRTGKSMSCGCGHPGPKRRHGHALKGAQTETYQVWRGMRRRCYDSRMMDFSRYGGRGITVCARWANFENFLADMGIRPPGMTIERKDNDGPYAPWNCVWASWGEQAVNKRNNRRLTYAGMTFTVSEWAALLGRPQRFLHKRLRSGWTTNECLETPIDLSKSHHGNI